LRVLERPWGYGLLEVRCQVPLIHRECVHTGCHRLIPKTETACDEHRQIDTRTRQDRIEGGEPWAFFYDSLEWAAIKARVRQRDGWRCTAVEETGRCTVVGGMPGQKKGSSGGSVLYVHHEWPLRRIWKDTGGQDYGHPNIAEFMRLACDMTKLRTLCATHHRKADLEMRQVIDRRLQKARKKRRRLAS
jgi:hypothetical protein